MKYEVTKCVCNNISFEEMKTIAVRNQIQSMEGLVSVLEVATNCRLCVPFIMKMLETGKTKFEIVSHDER